MLFTYKDLVVWQRSVELADSVYRLTIGFPSEEKYGLVSQMRRAAISISSNIAEGRLRGSDKSCRQFLLISFGSAGELDTQIQIAKRVFKDSQLDFQSTELLLDEVFRMLNKMIEQLSAVESLRT